MRCIREFANYRCREIKNDEIMDEGIKKELLKRIKNCIAAVERRIITPCEAMRRLANDCMIDGENMSKYREGEQA